MRIVKVSSAYPAFVRRLYATHPGLAKRAYAAQAATFYDGFFAWSDSWARAMAGRGHEMLEITTNAVALQFAWARENSVSTQASDWLDYVCVEQVKRFKPDVLWFDHGDTRLLRRLRANVPLRLVLGWVGSAVPRSDVFREMQLVLSCAPESVEQLERSGLRARHLDHAFDPRVNDEPSSGDPIALSFVGQICRGEGFHGERQRLLEALADRVALTVFTAEAGEPLADVVRAIWHGELWRDRGISLSALEAIAASLRAHLTSQPLAGNLHPAVYGREMYRTLRRSKITLNIHADSSPRFASNARLFETTGVGTCLLTDHRDNLAMLFEPDREVVAYRSAAECADKVGWLLEHPIERAAIAAAGQARTLRSHTFSERAVELDEILRTELLRT